MKSKYYSSNQQHPTEIKVLQKSLDATLNHVQHIFNSNACLQYKTKEFISNYYKILIKSNINNDVILKNVWLFNEPESAFRTKYQILQKYKIDINENIELLKIPLDVYSFYNNYMMGTADKKYVEKVRFMSKKLKVPEIKICELLHRNSYVRQMTFSKLYKLLPMLLKFGVKEEHIVNDPVVFQYEIDRIRKKFLIFKGRIKPDNIRMWMLRLSDKDLERICNYHLRIKSESVKNNFEDLCKILECDEKTVTTMFKKQPRLRNSNVIKVKEKIELLQNYGYSNSMIVNYPKILLFAYDTLKTRIELLKSANIDATVSCLAQSNKQMQLYINKKLNS
ncbi:uncharacterized protein mTTF isoform X2 [Prorops nasuta]|uniref:uncharacterized protein mTTF isoform X2 n=1 Tax=Prorops nasuta TaxID=863751 RepID=UPI0034CDBCA3